MTREQRRERDFWLGCAERVDGDPFGLCSLISRGEQAHKSARYDALDHFRPEGFAEAWWWQRWEWDVEHEAPMAGRVLAACFLAAMAELGE